MTCVFSYLVCSADSAGARLEPAEMITAFALGWADEAGAVSGSSKP